MDPAIDENGRPVVDLVDGDDDGGYGQVTKVCFGENQIDVPADQGVTLQDVRIAFGFTDRGILVAPAADGGTRPVATLPDDEVPFLPGVEVELVVYEDDAEREEGAIVRRLLAMGALAGSDADVPLAAEPLMIASKPHHASLLLAHRHGYDPWLAAGALPSAAAEDAYVLSGAPYVVGERPDVVEVGGPSDVWGITSGLGGA
jgi:hypothetical protein